LIRAWRSAAVLGFRTLVKIDVPLGRRLVRIFLGELQHLVELLAEHVMVDFVILDGLLEGVLAAASLGLEAAHGGLHVGEGSGLLVGFVPDYRRGGGIDVQLRLAAGARHGNEGRIGHTKSMVTRYTDRTGERT